jgi:hypothetical protein
VLLQAAWVSGMNRADCPAGADHDGCGLRRAVRSDGCRGGVGPSAAGAAEPPRRTATAAELRSEQLLLMRHR